MEVTTMLGLLVLAAPLAVDATSFKMDFLSSGTVRTDPLMFSQTGECLSDHVHRFYGAVSDLTMRPEVSYANLRNASGNTGNVEENKSLYWNPAIYKVVNQNSNKAYQIVDNLVSQVPVLEPRHLQGGQPEQQQSLPDCRRLVCFRLLHLAHWPGHRLSKRAEDEGKRQRGACESSSSVRRTICLRENRQWRLPGIWTLQPAAAWLPSYQRLFRAGNKHQIPHLLGRRQPGGKGRSEACGVR